MKKVMVVTAALLIVMSYSIALAQSDSIFVPGFGPFVPNFGVIPCFFGGQLLLGGEIDDSLGFFDLLLLRDQCLFREREEFGFGEEDDDSYMSEGAVNAKGSFSAVSDKVMQINMTSTLPLKFTSEDREFEVNCVQIVKGIFDKESEVFDGDIDVACNGFGKVKKNLIELATEIFPH